VTRRTDGVLRSRRAPLLDERELLLLLLWWLGARAEPGRRRGRHVAQIDPAACRCPFNIHGRGDDTVVT